VRIDHQVRDRSRRQQSLITPRRQIHFPRCPAEAGVQFLSSLGDIDIQEVPSRTPEPRGSSKINCLGVELEPTGWLYATPSQTSSAAQVGRLNRVLRQPHHNLQ